MRALSVASGTLVQICEQLTHRATVIKVLYIPYWLVLEVCVCVCVCVLTNAAETVGSQEEPIAAGTLETAVVVCTGLPTPSAVTGALVNVWRKRKKTGVRIQIKGKSRVTVST